MNQPLPFEEDEFVQNLLAAARYDEPPAAGYTRTAVVLGLSGLAATSVGAAQAATTGIAGASLGGSLGVAGGKGAAASTSAGALGILFAKSVIGTALVGGLAVGGLQAFDATEGSVASRVASDSSQGAGGVSRPAVGPSVRRGDAHAAGPGDAPPKPGDLEEGQREPRVAAQRVRSQGVGTSGRELAVSPKDAATVHEELSLLDGARQALNGGQAERALGLLSAHAQRFPDGGLRLEREVLRIRALDAIGQRSEARERARDFIQNHPQTPHAAQLREMLAPR